MKKHNWWIYLARFYSGMLNAGMLLAIGTMLTLHTGNLTRLSINSAMGNWSDIWSPALAIISYLIGVFFTAAYFGTDTKHLNKNYWKGYAFVACLFIILWLLPVQSEGFLVILSAAMGIVCSMPLTNNGYTGTITMMTGLMTAMITELSHAVFNKRIGSGQQFVYLFKNFIAYVLGALLQTFHYMHDGIVRAWPLLLMALILCLWAYCFGTEEPI